MYLILQSLLLSIAHTQWFCFTTLVNYLPCPYEDIHTSCIQNFTTPIEFSTNPDFDLTGCGSCHWCRRSFDPIIECGPTLTDVSILDNSMIDGDDLIIFVEFFDTDQRLVNIFFEGASDLCASILGQCSHYWSIYEVRPCSIIYRGRFPLSKTYRFVDYINSLGVTVVRNNLAGVLIAEIGETSGGVRGTETVELTMPFYIVINSEIDIDVTLMPYSICHSVICGDCQSCNQETGVCFKDDSIDGMDCDDGNFMTFPDQCVSGICVGTPRCLEHDCLPCEDCSVENDQEICVPKLEGSRCEDGKTMTVNDFCLGGECVGTITLPCLCTCDRVGGGCDQRQCPGHACCNAGNCLQNGLDFPTCNGGNCTQMDAFEPSCGGGLCTQTGAIRPKCNENLGCYGNCDYRELNDCECNECNFGICGTLPDRGGEWCNRKRGRCVETECLAITQCQMGHGCVNGGECDEVYNSYICKCSEGFTGDLCEIEEACEGFGVENGIVRFQKSADGILSAFFECDFGYNLSSPIGLDVKCVDTSWFPLRINPEGYSRDITCKDIDACEIFPCNPGNTTVTCKDIPGGPESADGRTCTCGGAPGDFYYDNESNQCERYTCEEVIIENGEAVLGEDFVLRMSCDTDYRAPLMEEIATCSYGEWTNPALQCVYYPYVLLETHVMTDNLDIATHVRKIAETFNLKPHNLELINSITYTGSIINFQDVVIPTEEEILSRKISEFNLELKNVALGKSAQQSSNYDHIHDASLTLDNNTDPWWTSHSFSMTGYGESWWEVELGSEFFIQSIIVFNAFEHAYKAMNYFHRIAPFVVEVYSGYDLVDSKIFRTIQMNYVWDSVYIFKADRVRVRLHEHKSWLHLAEVQIWSWELRTFTLVGDFNSLEDTSAFLEECTEALANVLCVHVESGSIIVTITGTEEALDAAVTEISMYGLVLRTMGSFPCELCTAPPSLAPSNYPSFSSPSWSPLSGTRTFIDAYILRNPTEEHFDWRLTVWQLNEPRNLYWAVFPAEMTSSYVTVEHIMNGGESATCFQTVVIESDTVRQGEVFTEECNMVEASYYRFWIVVDTNGTGAGAELFGTSDPFTVYIPVPAKHIMFEVTPDALGVMFTYIATEPTFEGSLYVSVVASNVNILAEDVMNEVSQLCGVRIEIRDEVLHEHRVDCDFEPGSEYTIYFAMDTDGAGSHLRITSQVTFAIPSMGRRELSEGCSILDGVIGQNPIDQTVHALTFALYCEQPCNISGSPSSLLLSKLDTTANSLLQDNSSLCLSVKGNCTFRLSYDPCHECRDPCSGEAICSPTPYGHNRTCTCPVRQSYLEGERCERVNGCDRLECHISSYGTECLEEANKERECRCKVGYHRYQDSVGCQEKNYCLPSSCENDEICVDRVGRYGYDCYSSDTDFDRTCANLSGMIFDDLYMGCIEHNECLSSPCNDTISSCVDRSAPATGFDCVDLSPSYRKCGPKWNSGCSACATGFQFIQSDCVDIDACLYFPCGDNALCFDIPLGENSTDGRICNCTNGFELTENEDCVAIGICNGVTCLRDFVCNPIDATCGCPEGSIELGVGDCKPINDCIDVDCGMGTCVDDALGYHCQCNLHTKGPHCEISKCDNCTLGYCDQTSCTQPVCLGGFCNQDHTTNPICNEGCSQEYAESPKCISGSCSQYRTTFPSCSGGNCNQTFAIAPECYGCGCDQAYAILALPCECCPGNCAAHEDPCTECFHGNVFIDFTKNGEQCDDGDPFTENDACQYGVCVGTETVCSSIPCPACRKCNNNVQMCVPDDDPKHCGECEACDDGDCSTSAALGMPCDDNDPSTVHDTCDGEGGCSGILCGIVCDEGFCDQTSRERPCCDGGLCDQRLANTPTCKGGTCDQRESFNCVCDGGFCDQTDCVDPSCKGGSCLGNCDFMDCGECKFCYRGQCSNLEDSTDCVAIGLENGTCSGGKCVGDSLACIGVVCPFCQKCVEGACETNELRQGMQCGNNDQNVCVNGECFGNSIKMEDIVGSISVVHSYQTTHVQHFATTLTAICETTFIHPWYLKETPFQIKSGEAASLTLHNICDVNDENDCTQRWELDINNQLGGETCFAADFSSRSWSNLEAEVSYLMNFELIPFVNFVSGVIAQGFVEQTDQNWDPIDVDNYLLGETVYINVRIENAEIMKTEYLILYVENSRFKIFGNLADTQAAGHLELQGVKSDPNMRYQFAIHEHVFSTEETRLDARLIIGIAVNPNNGVFSGSSTVHEFETSFVVSMIVCKEPYSDIPAVPGTLVLVPCDEGDGEWLAYCDVTGWDLDQSEGRSNCASSVTISSSLAPQKQQIGVPWWVWIALIVAAIILCILFGVFGGGRERVTEYYHSRYKEGYQRRSRGDNYHGGFFGYFGGTSYGDPRRGSIRTHIDISIMFKFPCAKIFQTKKHHYDKFLFDLYRFYISNFWNSVRF